MARHDKVSRSFSLLLAGAVAILAFAVVAHAAQTLTTPNAVLIAYNLGPNANLSINLPSNETVLVMGSDLDFAGTGDRGIGQANLVRNSVEGTLTWVEFDYTVIVFGGGSGLTTGDSHGTIVPILSLDRVGYVYVRSTISNNIEIVNTDSKNPGHKGSLTMIW
jgi:hypothetical protein